MNRLMRWLVGGAPKRLTTGEVQAADFASYLRSLAALIEDGRLRHSVAVCHVAEEEGDCPDIPTIRTPQCLLAAKWHRRAMEQAMFQQLRKLSRGEYGG